MTNKPQLIVVTLMPPQGTTGVQTHFNQIVKAAKKRGYATGIVHPNNYDLYTRKAVGLLTRLLRLFDKGMGRVMGALDTIPLSQTLIAPGFDNDQNTCHFVRPRPLKREGSLSRPHK